MEWIMEWNGLKIQGIRESTYLHISRILHKIRTAPTSVINGRGVQGGKVQSTNDIHRLPGCTSQACRCQHEIRMQVGIWYICCAQDENILRLHDITGTRWNLEDQGWRSVALEHPMQHGPDGTSLSERSCGRMFFFLAGAFLHLLPAVVCWWHTHDFN